MKDAERFRAEMRAFLVGQGFNSPQTKEFLRAPTRERNTILDGFAKEFGFFPRLIDTLCTGEVSFAVCTGGFLLGVEHKDDASIKPFVTQLTGLLDALPQVKDQVTTVEGRSRLLVPTLEGAFLMESTDKALAIVGYPDQKAV